MWPYFINKIKRLDINYDLLVTMPSVNGPLEDKIKRDKPDVKIIYVENHGRDVWPFLRAMESIGNITESYQSVLKIHSKKSKHRADGGDWLDDLTDSLIPQKGVKNILETLANESTGIIGPKGHYLPLAVNLPANGLNIKELLRKRYSYFKTRKVLNSSYSYGFFAGTMFWARMSAIKPVIDLGLKYHDFDNESGQIDGTMAHAIERVFCLIPELDNKIMYETSRGGEVTRIPYHSTNIPEWSDLKK